MASRKLEGCEVPQYTSTVAQRLYPLMRHLVEFNGTKPKRGLLR